MLKSHAVQYADFEWNMVEGLLWLIVPKRLSSVLTLALSCVVSAETFSCDASSSLRSLRI